MGPSALAVGAVGVVWMFFSRLSFLFSLPLWEMACRLSKDPIGKENNK